LAISCWRQREVEIARHGISELTHILVHGKGTPDLNTLRPPAFRLDYHPVDRGIEAMRRAAPFPRIARLMALAIRFEGLLREDTIRDYFGRIKPGPQLRDSRLR
jgi:hypothetical protein